MEARFPPSYPAAPFFLRVVTPRMVMYTGHVHIISSFATSQRGSLRVVTGRQHTAGKGGDARERLV